MKVLLIVPSFYPATFFGGPVSYLHGLCNALATESNVEIRVLTTDTAGQTTDERLSVAGFPVKFPAGYEVYYCRKNFGVSFSVELFRHLPGMLAWADIVTIHGVYSSPTIPALLACRLLRKPVSWSPHGSLQRWQRTQKRIVKGIWEVICSALCLPERTIFLVTSEREGQDSVAKLKKLQYKVVPIGVDLPASGFLKDWQPNGVLRLLFLGRLDPIKGIDNLIRALALSDANTSLTICGEGKEEYQGHLLGLIQNYQLQDRVYFHGHVDEAQKRAAFSNADVLVLPSYTENFGIVIAEALAHGLPVIASKGTPWEGMEEQDCGIWTGNTPEELAAAISDIRKRDLEEMGRKGSDWVKRNFTWQIVAKRYMDTLNELLNESGAMQ